MTDRQAAASLVVAPTASDAPGLSVTSPARSGAVVSGWDRRMQKTRSRLQMQARRLFRERGFAATTSREIAEAAGVSERTFFRYFTTKQEAAFGDLHARGQEMVAIFAAWPASEPLIDWVRNTLGTLAASARSQEERLEELELVSMCPELLTYVLEMTLTWETELAEIISSRLDDTDGFRARLLAASITSLIRVAFLATVDRADPDVDLFEIAARGLEIIAPIFDAPLSAET